MPRFDTAFLILGLACFALGACLGLHMGISQDFLLAPVHGHLNLVGGVSLALFGLIHRAYPELSKSVFARVHFWLAAPSAVVFPIGIYFVLVHHVVVLAIAAAVTWFLGVVVLLVALVDLVISGARAQEHEPWHG